MTWRTTAQAEDERRMVTRNAQYSGIVKKAEPGAETQVWWLAAL